MVANYNNNNNLYSISMRKISLLLLWALLPLSAAAYTLGRVTVHDPSIVWERNTSTYYIFGSHRQAAKTTDLMNWTAFTAPWGTASSTDAANADAFTTNQLTTFGGGKNYNAYAWASAIANSTVDGSSWGNIDGNMWAPDVIWNPTLGKWCMYLSLNGIQWNSCVILLTAESIEGPYTYQAPIVYSGFNVTNAEATSYKNTDLELVLGEQDALPARYAKGNSWGTYWPHCIDPCVFYDKEGDLWMTYGSWSGGIYILKLDKTTGLRDYTYKPELAYSDDTKEETVLADPYFGKKIAGGCYVSGEASYIERIGDYYYLFMSYGFYDTAGGYQMRVFRSSTPDGTYVDPMHGNNAAAIFPEYRMNYGAAQNTIRGENIFGAYGNWGNQVKGVYSEREQGHNSIIAAEDGHTYLVYHTRFQNRGSGHEVRVHQVFQNEDGWLVAAPFEYTGETLKSADIAITQQIPTANIPGKYKLLVHRNGLDYTKKEIATPVEIELKSDGSISGAYNGTWSITEGKSYITITLGGITYKGVLIEQTMEPTTDKCVAFTAMAKSDGVCIWGHKYTPEEPVAEGTYDITTDVKAYYNFDSSPIANYYNDAQEATLQQEGTNTVPYLESESERSGKVIHTNFGASGATSNVKFANPLNGLAALDGATFAFWVNPIDENLWDALFCLYNSSGGRLYLTGNNYVGFNSGGWVDYNHSSDVQTGDITFGDWNFVTLTVSRTAGFKMYINGVEKTLTATRAGTDEAAATNDMFVDFIKSCPDMYFGYGSWWGSANAQFDELLVFSRALTATDAKALYQKEVADGKYTEVIVDPDYTTGIKAYYTFDNDPVGNIYDKTQTVELTKLGEGTLPEVIANSDRSSKVMHTFFGAQANASSVKFVNPLHNVTLTDGATVAFWVNRQEDNVWDALFSFYDPQRSAVNCSVSGNTYICYNDMAGNWIDINQSATVTNNIAVNSWHYVAITLSRTDGFSIYVDGVQKPFSAANGSVAVNAFDYNQIVSHIINSSEFYFGNHSFWGSAPALYDNLVFYDRPLSSADVAALYATENAGSGSFPDVSGVTDGDYMDGLVAYYDFETDPAKNFYNAEQTATLQQEGETALPAYESDATLGSKVVHTAFGGSGVTSNVKFDNPLYGQTLTDGASVSFWVNSIASGDDKNQWDEIFSFYDKDASTDAGFFMNGNTYIRFNDWGGNWVDLNVNLIGENGGIMLDNLNFGSWDFVTMTASRTDGIKLYINGKQITFQRHNGSVNYFGGAVDYMKNCKYFYFGYGPTWGSQNAMYDELLFHTRPLTGNEVKALYDKEFADKTLFESITLTDATGITSLTNGWTGNVTFIREFTGGKKHTVCLPFKPTALKSGGKLYEFTGIEDGKMVMTEVTASELEANKPYIYEPTGDQTSNTFNGITINIGTSQATTQQDFTFQGTYTAKNTWTEDELGKCYGFTALAQDGFEQGVFAKLGSGASVPAFRAYLKYVGTGSLNYDKPASGSARTRGGESLPETIGIIWRRADGTTEISGIAAQPQLPAAGWYTLDGRKLAGKPVRKGVYVNDGRKVVIK